MSIKTRILIIFCFFLALLLMNAVFINVWIDGAKDSMSVINQLGRQRMLSQKMTKEIMFTLNGKDKSSELTESKNQFEKVLYGMLNGSKELGFEAATDPELVSQLKDVDRSWISFKNVSQQLTSANSPKLLDNFYDGSIKLLRESHEVVLVLEEDFNGKIKSLYIIVISFFLVSIVAAVIGFWMLKKYLFERIEGIKSTSENIIESKDLTMRIKIDDQDEIGSTAGAFNQMIESFVHVNEQTNQLEQELQNQLEMLAIATQENSSSMNIQRNEIVQVSTAVNEMATTVQEVARNTQEAATVATNAQSEAKNGSELLEASMKLTHSLASEVRDASENIEKLAMASDSIGGIADTISTIAEQTNLLALNAAIEAARAGEQGRGFAVVADEVRTLAQRTQEATSEIHKLISTLQDTTQASVETMENSKQRSEQGVEQAENMATALKAIINSVQNLSNINHQIAVAAEQQTAVADEINENIVRIESKAENTFANAEASAQYTQNLSDMASRLRECIQEYKID
nr:methyl-accepting chemotaxis protein [Agarilytica rhodophyticola]